MGPNPALKYRRLRQEIEASAVADARAVTDHNERLQRLKFSLALTSWFQGAQTMTGATGQRAQATVAVLSDVIIAGRLTVPQVRRLFELSDLSTSAEGNETVLELLGHPEALRCLLTALFSVSHRLSGEGASEALDQCSHLLAVLVHPQYRYPSLQPAEGDEATEAAGAGAMDTDMEPVGKEETQSLLSDLSGRCFRAKGAIGAKKVDVQSDVEAGAEQAMAIPVVSSGLILWMESLIATQHFSEDTGNVLRDQINSLLYLAQITIERHPDQRPAVLAFLRGLVTMPTGKDRGATMDVKRDAVQCLVHLMSTGFCLPVLDLMLQEAGSLDQGLLRAFLLHLASIAGGPFSSEFVVSLTALLSHDAMVKSLGVNPSAIQASSGTGSIVPHAGASRLEPAERQRVGDLIQAALTAAATIGSEAAAAAAAAAQDPDHTVRLDQIRRLQLAISAA